MEVLATLRKAGSQYSHKFTVHLESRIQFEFIRSKRGSHTDPGVRHLNLGILLSQGQPEKLNSGRNVSLSGSRHRRSLFPNERLYETLTI